MANVWITSGSLGFAIYNNRFFPKGSEHLENIYKDLQSFLDNIVADIRKLVVDEERYEKLRSEYLALNSSLYSKVNTLHCKT